MGAEGSTTEHCLSLCSYKSALDVQRPREEMEELKRENARLREENGQLREEVQHLRLRLGISEGLPPAAGGGGEKEVAVCDWRYGHALPKLMALLCAKICIVSTPEHGGPPDERGGYSVPVMSGLERLAGYVFPQVLGSYDFKGSASQRECAAQVPDRDIHDWGTRRRSRRRSGSGTGAGACGRRCRRRCCSRCPPRASRLSRAAMSVV